MDTAQLPAFLAGLGIGVAACGGMIVALRVQRAAYLDLRERMQARENEERERYRYALAQGAVSTNEARAMTGEHVVREAPPAERVTYGVPPRTALLDGDPPVVTLEEKRRMFATGGPLGRQGEDTQ